MKFTLEIELDGVVNTPVDVAELLTNVLNELREDGFGEGTHDVNTRSMWQQSEDGESSELVRHTVGRWTLSEDRLGEFGNLLS